MSDEQDQTKTRERLKLAAIPILLAVLGGVVLWPDDHGTTTAIALNPQITATTVTFKTELPTEEPVAVQSGWPVVNLESLAAGNPFVTLPTMEPIVEEPTSSTPTAPSPSAITRKETDIVGRPVEAAELDDELIEPLVHEELDLVDYSTLGTLRAVISGPGGNVALVGEDELVRAGDVMKSGFRVAEINDQTVLVDRHPVRPSMASPTATEITPQRTPRYQPPPRANANDLKAKAAAAFQGQ